MTEPTSRRRRRRSAWCGAARSDAPEVALVHRPALRRLELPQGQAAAGEHVITARAARGARRRRASRSCSAARCRRSTTSRAAGSRGSTTGRPARSPAGFRGGRRGGRGRLAAGRGGTATADLRVGRGFAARPERRAAQDDPADPPTARPGGLQTGLAGCGRQAPAGPGRRRPGRRAGGGPRRLPPHHAGQLAVQALRPDGRAVREEVRTWRSAANGC